VSWRPGAEGAPVGRHEEDLGLELVVDLEVGWEGWGTMRRDWVGGC
jgi:hypothetical protein